MGARRSTACLLLALIALAGVAPVYSLHEDQAGSYDWHKSFLGEATQAAFAGSKQNMRAFVSTEQGAIGAIEFKTGDLVWRHVLEDGDVVDRLMIASRQLLTVSSAGKYLRSWSMRDGSLLWELVTYTAAAPSADAKAERDRDRGVDVLPLGADIDGDGDEDLLMLSRGEVQLRSLSEGVAAWSTEAAEAFDETVRLHRVARDPTTGKIIAFGVTEDDGSPAEIGRASCRERV